MPTLSKPLPIAGPFAYNGDKNAIPDAAASPGAASFQQGFPPITQLPLTAGGVPPQRNDFNGILNALSQHVFWQQSGGMYDWSATLDYAVPAMVAGSDGQLYIAQQLSGPNSPVGVKNPVDAGSGDYWQVMDFSGLPPIDGQTIVEQNGALAVNTSATPANGKIPIGEASGRLSVGWVQDGTTGQKGVVKLNSAVNSTSTTEAATPSAVKTAYDTAINAQNTASSAQSTANSAYSMASNAGGAPTPSSYSGKGQWRSVSGTGSAFPLPSGGTWAYYAICGNGAGYLYGANAGVASGGSSINLGYGGTSIGFVWRVA